MMVRQDDDGEVGSREGTAAVSTSIVWLDVGEATYGKAGFNADRLSAA